MNPDPKHVEAVFAATLDKTSDKDRLAYLDEACASDPVLRQRVEALLKAHDEAGSFLDKPVLDLAEESRDTPNAAAQPTARRRAAPQATTIGSHDAQSAGAVAHDSDHAAADSLVGTTIRYVGDYELLEEIARGGMGVVYKARQISLNRMVALKMILAGQLASQSDVERFRTEAQAAGDLGHPSIVPIYEVGEHHQQHYFSMKLIEGGSLANWIAGCRSEIVDSQADAVRLLATVARAVHCAHQRGILHRDLKPANILLERDRAPSGQSAIGNLKSVIPFVTDFGLAKRVEGDSQQTRSGAIVGTPSYMAPEQARAEKRLTTAVDVYSLGAILFEVLTGKPPFRAESVLDTVLQVIEREPEHPRRLNPAVDPDLAVIALKCLEKDPARRYASAAALADDLERWLRGEPILARPTSSWERTVKWARRRPAVAALLGAVVMTAALGMAGVIWKWQDAVAAEHSAVQAEKKARDTAAAEKLAKQAAIRAEKVALANAEAEKAAKVRAEKAQRAEAEARKQEAKAKDAAIAAQRKEALAREGEVKARKQAENERDAKNLALTRAEGLRLAAEADAARFRDPGLALLLAIEGTKRTPHHLTFSSLYAAMSACREVRVVNHGDRFSRFLPDGKRILTVAGPTLQVHEVASGKTLLQWPGYGLPIESANLSPDGTKVIVTGNGHAAVVHADDKTYRYTDRLAFVIDLTTGKEVHRLRGSKDKVLEGHFSPDGKLIVTASWDGAARVYDAATAKLLATTPLNKASGLFSSNPSLKLVRFTPDSGMEVGRIGNPSYKILTVKAASGWSSTYSENDKVPLDPDYDPEARVGSGSGHSQMSVAVEVTANVPGPAKYLSLLDGSRTVARLWEIMASPVASAPGAKSLAYFVHIPPGLNPGPVGRPQAADISLNGALVAIAFETEASIYEAGSGKFICSMKGHDGGILAIAFRPDGKLIATASSDRTVRLWDVKTGKETLRLRGHNGAVSGLRFDRTGKWLASRSVDATARIWEVDSGVEMAVLRGHGSAVADVDISPDGKLAVTSSGNLTRIWSLEAPGMPEISLTGHKIRVATIDYSPDGKLAVTASQDGTARIWDTATGKEVRALGLERFLGPLRMARFSLDGKRIVTAAGVSRVDKQAKLAPASVMVWDVDSGKEVLALKELETGASAAFFSPDGKHILTMGDGHRRISNVPAKEPAKEPAKKGPKQAGKEIDLGIGVKVDVNAHSTAELGRLQLWDATTGKLVGAVPGRKHDGWTSSDDDFVPRFAPDGKRLISYDVAARTPKLFDAMSGKLLAEYRGPQGYGRASFVFAPDGTRVIVAKGTQITIYDTETGNQLFRFKGFRDVVGQLAVSGDGKRLLAIAGKIAHAWDLGSRKLLATFRGHENIITTLAVNHDGSQALTGSSDGTAGLWDVATGTMMALYRGHSGGVHQVAFRADGKQVATVSEDATARLWPVDLWSVVLPRRTRDLTYAERERYELLPANQPVYIPQADPPPGVAGPEPFELNRPVVTATVKKAIETARLREQLPGALARLDAAHIPEAERLTGQPRELVAVLGEQGHKEWHGVSKVAISDSKRLIAASDYWYGETRLWDAASLRRLARLPGKFCGFIRGRDQAVLQVDRKLQVWDLAGPQPREISSDAFTGYRSSVAVSPDARCAVLSDFGRDQKAVWFYQLGKQSKPISLMPLPTQDSNEHVRAFFSPDGKRVGLHRRMDKQHIHVFDVDGPTPRKRATLKIDAPYLESLDYALHGNLIAVPVDKSVRCWDLSNEMPVIKFEIKLATPAQSVRFTIDGQSLFVGSAYTPVRVFDLKSKPPRELYRLPLAYLHGAAVADDGKLVAVGHNNTMRVWDRVGDAYVERKRAAGHLSAIASLDFNASDDKLASTDGGPTQVWTLCADNCFRPTVFPAGADSVLFMPNSKDLLLSQGHFTLWDTNGPNPVQRTKPLDWHDRNWGQVKQSFSADGKVLVRGGGEPDLSIIDLDGPQPKIRFTIKKLMSRRVTSLSLSPDGQILVTAPYDSYSDDSVVRLWRITSTGLVPVSFPAIKTERVAFAPDGMTLAVGDQASVGLWDLSGKLPMERARLPVQAQYSYFRFNATGTRLVTWYGTKLALWDTSNGKQLQSWDWPGAIGAVCFAHDGKHLAVGNANGTIYILRLPGLTPP